MHHTGKSGHPERRPDAYLTMKFKAFAKSEIMMHHFCVYLLDISKDEKWNKIFDSKTFPKYETGSQLIRTRAKLHLHNFPFRVSY